MRLIATFVSFVVLGGQNYPPPQGHAVFLPAGTVHTGEPIGSATKATIFELK